MATNRSAAKDAMYALVKAVIDTEGITHAVYEDTAHSSADGKPASTATTWVRVSVKHRGGDSTSLSSAGGKQRHQMDGFVLIELFTPVGDGNVMADDLAFAFETAFRERSPHNQVVWFTGVHSREIGNVDGWYKTNTVAEFHYDLFQ